MGAVRATRESRSLIAGELAPLQSFKKVPPRIHQGDNPAGSLAFREKQRGRHRKRAHNGRAYSRPCLQGSSDDLDNESRQNRDTKPDPPAHVHNRQNRRPLATHQALYQTQVRISAMAAELHSNDLETAKFSCYVTATFNDLEPNKPINGNAWLIIPTRMERKIFLICVYIHLSR